MLYCEQGPPTSTTPTGESLIGYARASGRDDIASKLEVSRNARGAAQRLVQPRPATAGALSLASAVWVNSEVRHHQSPLRSTMYEVTQDPASHSFQTAWRCAGQHLQKQGGDGINWLRADLQPPLAEHLSFRLANQLVFVFIQMPDNEDGPSSLSLFLSVCKEATAIPALMPMERISAAYQPTFGGWGLRHALTHAPVDPPSLVTNELIEMSDWELHDFAIQVVTSQIEASGGTILSKQPSRHIDPSIWFRDKSGPGFVVVRSGRFPLSEAPRPTNFRQIAKSCERLSRRGYFASVTVANAEQQHAHHSAGAIPLYRGHGMVVRYPGLQPLSE